MMASSRLPLRFALIGVTLAILVFALAECVNIFNLFHLPTVEQASHMQNYTAPWLYFFLTQGLTVIVCPAMALFWLPIPASTRDVIILAGICALTNAPLYYCLGFAVEKIRKYLVAR
jgi:hypothetical protein